MKFHCSNCGIEISKVIYVFTLLRHGSGLCYSCMRVTRQIKRDTEQDIKKGKK